MKKLMNKKGDICYFDVKTNNQRNCYYLEMKLTLVNSTTKRFRKYNNWSIRSSKVFKTSLDSEVIYKQYFKEELIQYGFIDNTDSINNLFKEFIDEKRIRSLKEETIKNYEYTFTKYFDMFTSTSSSDLNEVFNKDNVRLFVQKLETTTKDGKLLSDRRKNKIYNTCYNLIKYAKENKYIDEYTYKTIAPLVIKRGLGKYNTIFDSNKLIKKEDMVKFLDTFDNEDIQFKIYFEIGFTTGLRFGEILGLQWKHVNFKDKLLNITQQLNKRGKIDVPKTLSSKASIPLNNALYNELLKIYDTLEPLDNDFIIYLNEPSKPISRSAINRIKDKHVKMANIPNFKNHDMRHTFGSNIFNQKEENIPIASKLLRHSSIKTTMDIYLHSPEAIYKKGINDLNNLCDDIINKKSQ